MKRSVLIITGCIASGKSTVARRVAEEVRAAGRLAAVIDTDLLHAMLADRPAYDEPMCRRVRQLTGDLAAALLAQGHEVVVVEGEYWTEESRQTVASRLNTDVRQQLWTLTVSFEEALRRARGEASRGMSKDPVFLAGQLTAFADALPELARAGHVVDTETIQPAELARQIAQRV